MKVPFPLEGLDETNPADDQIDRTSRGMQNMVAQNPRDRVLQGAQRAGTVRFVAPQVHTTKIQDLASITTKNKLIDYTASSASENVVTLWEATPSTLGSTTGTPLQEVRRLAIDDEGNIFAVWGKNAITIFSADGQEIQTVFVDGIDDTFGLVPIVLDEFGNFYVGTASNAVYATGERKETVWKYEKVSKPDGTSWEYKLRWSTDLFNPDYDQTPTLFHESRCQALAYSRATGELYVVCHESDTTGGTPPQWDVTLVVLGDLDFDKPTMKKRVVLLDTVGASLSVSANVFATDIALRSDGAFYVSLSGDGPNTKAPGVFLWKGDLPPLEEHVAGKAPGVNAYQGKFFTNAGGDHGGGYGLALLPDEKSCYTAGPRLAAAGLSMENFGIMRLAEDDTGTTLFSANVAFITDGPPVKASAPTSIGPICHQLATDRHGVVYVPFWTESLGTATDAYTMVAYHSAGSFTLYTKYIEYITGGSLSAGNRLASQPCRAVAVASSPDHEGDLSDSFGTCTASGPNACVRSEDVVLGLGSNTFGSATGGLNTLRKIQLVQSARNANTPRGTDYLAVANADLYKLDPVGGTVSNTFTTDEDPFVAGSTPRPRFVQGVNLLQERFYTDGRTYGVYTPKDDSWKKLVAEQGELPKRCELISTTGGRLVLARAADNPHIWYMSRVANPRDWDGAPAREDVGQAISGTNPGGPGLCPDAITALVPLQDDLLVFGCDSSLQRLTGDPLDGGTRFDLMTSEVGMAYGEPWAKDRQGNVYFIDSEGGLNKLLYGPPWYQRISRDRIENRLRSVNFSTHYVRLRWDNRYEGLWIVYMPFADTGSTSTEHYFWDPRFNAFYPIKFGGQSPTAIATVDSDDPDDRTVITGWDDGYVRAFGDSADQDDDASGAGVAIDSYVDIGPLRSEQWDQWRMAGWNFTLTRNLGGVTYEIYRQDTADAPLDRVVATGYLGPGRTRIRRKVKAAYVTIRLRSSGPFSWAYEDGHLEGIVSAGRTRPGVR